RSRRPASSIVSDRDVDISLPHRNGIVAQAVAPIRSAPAACQVVLPTVPRTHEMRLGLVQPLPAYCAVGVEPLLVAPDDPAGANRSPLVHAAVLVGDQPALDAEHAYFDVACYSQHSPVFRDLAERHDTVLDGATQGRARRALRSAVPVPLCPGPTGVRTPARPRRPPPGMARRRAARLGRIPSSHSRRRVPVGRCWPRGACTPPDRL